MRLIDPFAEQRWNTVSVKGIIAGFHTFTKIFTNSIEPLLFHLPDFPETPLSRFGTAFKVRSGRRYFLVCTDHQVKNADPTSVVLLREDARSIFTSHSAVYSHPDSHGEPTIDLRLFEFTKLVVSGKVSSIGWWDIADRVDEASDNYEFLVATGYPSFNNTLDYETLNLRLAPRGIFGRRVASTLGGLRAIKLENELTYDPDGLSGSPIFALVESSSGLRASLAGILSNAGRFQLNFIPVTQLTQIIDFAGLSGDHP